MYTVGESDPLRPATGGRVLAGIRPGVQERFSRRTDWRIRSLLVWIVPGSLFFIFILISSAPYLNYLTAAILLLAVSVPGKWIGRLLVVTALWNAFLFLALGPIPSRKLPVNIVNSFVLRYTRGGIEQRYSTILSEMQHFDNAE